MKKISILFGITILCALFLLGGCHANSQNSATKKTETSFFALNTYVTITAYGEHSENAVAAARQLISECEDAWSVTDTGSELYAINHSGGVERRISGQTAELIAFALEMADKTNGALEPTIYPVLCEWGFTTGQYRVPSAETLDLLLKNVGYGQVCLDGNTILIPEKVQLDLGAVAKGYIGDLVAIKLKEYAIDSAIINLGGNIQLIGGKTDDTDWNIGIRSPFEQFNFGTIKLYDKAIITSGGYERNFTGGDGKVYHHIIDPNSGYPAESGLASVSIISGDGKLCDALSTACYVMGAEKSIEYWRENGGFDMVLVTDNKEVLITETINERFSLSEEASEWNVNIIKKQP